MAEFALGLTKTAVERTLSLVKSAVEEEKKLREKVQNDLVFISGEFEVMQSFLRIANRERAVNDEVVLTLVRQLRTLAFDVEDCVENVIHLDLDKSSCSAWLLRAWHTVYCCARPLPLDDAVAEIKQLKARVEDVSQRNARYNHILHGSDKNNKQQQQPYATTTTYDPSSVAFHVLRDAWEATGKWRSNMCDLRQELLITPEGEDDHDLQVISVWGSTSTTGGGGADLGTASVFRKTYRDPKICEKFKLRAWVKLTHPFNHDEFVKSLLAQFSVSSSSHQANTGVDFSWTTMKSAEVLEAEGLMKAKLMNQRYLVVLEDVFTLEEWDVVRMYLPESKNGSRIVVSTPQLGIGLLCTGEPYQVSELTKFPCDNQFLCAFFKTKPRDMAELRRHGVISVWGTDDDDKSNLIDILYKGIINGKFKGSEGFFYGDKSDHVGMLRKGLMNDEVEFERHSWVDVPDPFDLKAFGQRLFLNFHSDDIRASKITEGGKMGQVGLIQRCLRFLFEEDCLVVINGLRSKVDWDLIERTFLSSKPTAKGCIIVITNEETVARHCVKDHKYQAFNVRDLKADTSISTLVNKQKALKWIEEFEPLGRETEVDQLTDYVRSPRLGLVSVVWGIPGVGKSTLVRTIYYTEMLHSSATKQAFKAFGWVDVPSPFNLTDFGWRLLLDLYSDDPQAKQTAAVSMVEQGQDPILECCKILHEKKCLVVIDGLHSTQEWDLIKATFLSKPFNIGTVIIVITTEEKVVKHRVQNIESQVLNIRCLEADAALSLLEKTPSKYVLTGQGFKVPKSIANKCGGLPKVIAAIGKTYKSWTLESLRDNFMGELETDQEFHGLRHLFSWMQSYFDACSDSIKPCIFYLSIFSAEKNIRRRRLLWRWIAEGYCRDTSDDRTCEENGENFISDLINLSIVQQYSPRNKVFCQINGFFHEYIISRPMEDNLVFALEGHCSLNSTRAGQHLTIRSSWDKDEVVYESIDFSRLRSLTVFGKWEPFFISSKNVNMRLLRVLDLEDATDVTNDDVEQIGKLLRRLKFLSLRGCREITCLPSSIGDLRQLQTLDIRHTSIATLPIFITKLQKLRYIRAGTTTEVWDWEGDVVSADGVEEDRASSSAQAVTNLPAGSSVSCNNCPRTLVFSLLSKLCRCGGLDNNGGVKVPVGIKNLAALHTLGVVNVNCTCCGKSIFKELKKLTQLRKLGMSGIKKGNIQEFCSAVSGHAHLKSLSVELDKDDGLDDNIPEPPKTIKSLKLYGRVHKLLVWMKHLHSLEKLHLTIEKPEELRDLPELSNKPFIHHLRIRPIQDGELCIGPCWGFAQVLEIQCSTILHMKFDDRDNVWLNVGVLKVHFSGGSQSSLQISGLSRLTDLKEVWLKGYTDAHKQYMQRQIEEMHLQSGRKRPVLKLVRPRSS